MRNIRKRRQATDVVSVKLPEGVDPNPGIFNQPFVVGGVDAELSDYTFMALLGYDFRDDRIVYTCGGSLINKFYVLDLKEKNSLIKWIVDQGYTLFVVSWVNPDPTYAEIGMEDYIEHGYLTAIDVAKEITGEKQVNAIGYCIAGTTLSATLGLLKKRKDTSVKSATLFTALTDFELGGKTIRQGDKVVMFYVSGNRDEDAFENPDQLILDRETPRLLSFGSGIHHCIGFRVARMQLQHMWQGMLDRFGNIELADEPVRSRSNFVQGYQSMQVVARA